MTRVEFTCNIVALLNQMILLGEHPIGDFWKRSDEEQHRLWKIGRDEEGNKIGDTVTNCDGINSISGHQRGKALDILFLNVDGKLVAPQMGYEHWHKIWEGWGGKPEILDKDGKPCDRGHWEG